MASQSIPPSQALKQATNALQRGDKHAARAWAQIAASLAPDMEEPWLILAAVARPHASIAYLERALEINPESKRARAGLVWAHQQHAHEKTHALRRTVLASSARAELPDPGNSTIQTGKPALQIPPKAIPGIRFSIPLLLLILAICLIAVWAFWPGAGSSVSAAILGYPGSAQDSHILSWLPVGLVKPTDTPLPTSTSTPTAYPLSNSITNRYLHLQLLFQRRPLLQLSSRQPLRCHRYADADQYASAAGRPGLRRTATQRGR